jgi:hypothetical protein
MTPDDPSKRIAFYRKQAAELRRLAKAATRADTQNDLSELAAKHDVLAARLIPREP